MTLTWKFTIHADPKIKGFHGTIHMQIAHFDFLQALYHFSRTALAAQPSFSITMPLDKVHRLGDGYWVLSRCRWSWERGVFSMSVRILKTVVRMRGVRWVPISICWLCDLSIENWIHSWMRPLWQSNVRFCSSKFTLAIAHHGHVRLKGHLYLCLVNDC